MSVLTIPSGSYLSRNQAAATNGTVRSALFDRSPGQGSRRTSELPTFRLTSHLVTEEPEHRQSEIFYLQKQIQAQTPMVVVLDDGEQVEGCIEWYDRNTIKVRGRARTLIYKSAIKYMYKVGENG